MTKNSNNTVLSQLFFLIEGESVQYGFLWIIKRSGFLMSETHINKLLEMIKIATNDSSTCYFIKTEACFELKKIQEKFISQLLNHI